MHGRRRAVSDDVEKAQAPTVTDLDEIETRAELRGCCHVASEGDATTAPPSEPMKPTRKRRRSLRSDPPGSIGRIHVTLRVFRRQCVLLWARWTC